MIQRWKRWLVASTAVTALVLCLGTTATAADPPGVSPSSVNQTMLPGDSITIAKTVQTDSIPPNPDLVFLADTTGSMASAIGNVQSNAVSVMNTVLAAQPSSFFGAASYKDFNCDEPLSYSVNAPLSPSTAVTQAGINTWFASGGCDLPEANLNALTQVANGFTWRPGSSRVIAWFGDAPGHDPSNGATLSSTIAALQAQNIRVIAVSTGIDQLDSTGQASAITSATGGVLLHTGDDVASAILAGLADLPAEVGWTATCTPGLNVSLSPATETVNSGDAAHFTETISLDPNALAGSYACTVSFTINGVPGGPDFDEHITINVPAPDLSILKSGPAAATAGDNVTYTLAATNNGPTTATGVTVSDPVPANATFVSASAGCAFAAGVVTCSAGTLASGASQSFSVTMLVGPGGDIANTATVSGDQADPNPSNNSSTVTTSVNHSPVCTGASAGPNLWPPNHRLVWSSISGVTDPDGNPVSITITGIRQDEPTNGLGDGDTAIDGIIGAGNSFAVRAERSGKGDGRVYHVLFTASDGAGGSCTGSATIGVPHDQGPSGGPIDQGPLYDSTS